MQLYRKSHQPMTESLFANPDCEYRAAPFWAWNGKLTREDLLWQMKQLKKMGFGGVHIHVRTGLETEYLGTEFFDLIHACVEKARQEHMLVWLYDEDRWPSGAAGGLVTKDPAYRQRYAVFTRTKRKDGHFLAAYDITLNPDGTLNKYRRMGEEDTAEGFPLYVYREIMGDSPWYNNQAYVNTLDPQSIRQFLRITHEAYAANVGRDFGGVIPAIFTDEPQFSRKQTLNYALDTRDITLPWTDDLPETYTAAFHEDIFDGMPELLWDLPDGKASILRYRFHDHIAERFSQAFADQCGAWCDAHGLMLTGHMMSEPTLESQTSALGEAMRSYRGFQMPGIDMLCDWREYTTAKQAQSASRQFGREGVLSELYGVTNWNFDFRGHKLAGDWQAALGVTVRVPHLSWVSMNGEAKRDYPATFNYQTPWYREYSYVENHFARLNTVLTRGTALCRVGVIHPVESYWLHWGAKENTAAIRTQMDEHFRNLTEWLLRGLIDFDFISESLLPQQCPEDFTEDTFPVGKMHYETILVPPVETLRSTTISRLRHFVGKGGRVIFLGSAPELADAIPSDAPKALFDVCEHCLFDRVSLLERLSGLRDVEVRDERGIQTNYLLHQMRQEKNERWLFICHADPCRNPDVPECHQLRIRLRGTWDLTLYNTLDGQITPLCVRHTDGWTIYETSFYDQDSLLLRLSPVVRKRQICEAAAPDAVLKPFRRFLGKMDYVLEEPNVLLLDRAEYALDDELWNPAEDILRLDNEVRRKLGWPLRGGAIAQPWVETDHSTPHTLNLRYTIRSEINISMAELALENASACTVTLNGQRTVPAYGWYVDKCIRKVILPQIRPGENKLEVSIPYGKRTNPEAMYLLGAFGVKVQGVYCTLTALPCEITFGDITRQGLPFYGGNITYRIHTNLPSGQYALQVSDFRSALLRVSLDGKDLGVIAYAPYRIMFDIPKEGRHTLEIKAFGCRINTFGQVHLADKTITWWGPDSWRTVGVMWSDEYCLWQQGILKSPELFEL
ncbi:MAG: hypothetical protein IJL88_09750 [Clostridia bacterium]|nr:hypothetical protein [Clostridia bacterium]